MPNNTSKLAPEQTALRAALTYARRGWHVYPVRPSTRRPILSEETTGRKRGASNDLAVVAQMFARYPLADVGAVTGALSGFFVMETDNKNGKNGSESLQRLLMQQRVHLPWTAKAASPTGGEHLFFRHPGRPVRTTTSKLGSGIDILGENFNVIVPPSRGRSWITSLSAIAPAPSWLVELVCEERFRAQGRGSRDPRSGAELSPQQPAMPPTPEMLAMMMESAGRGLSDDPADALLPEDAALKVAAALTVISPDLDYLDWFRAGCAIYAALGDDGFDLFDDWSGGAPHKYPGASGIAAKWRECAKARAINVDTLYWLADQCDRGWRDTYARLLREETAS